MPHLIATIIDSNGKEKELWSFTFEEMQQNVGKAQKKHKVRKDYKTVQPQEGEEYKVDSGKVQKTAAVLGAIPLSKLDLSRFQQ